MDDSKIYIENIIYDENGRYESPTPHDDLYYIIQTLTYLYRNNPDWPEDFQRDIMEYVQECVNMLEMN